MDPDIENSVLYNSGIADCREINSKIKELFIVTNGRDVFNKTTGIRAVLGNLVRLRTRQLNNCILLRASWKSLVALTAPAVEELRY